MTQHILVTNDDGVFAPGLLSLAEEVQKFGKVSILAPDSNWIGGAAPTGIPERGTDVGALAEGFVPVTPLQLDLTSYRTITELNTWQWDDESNSHPAPQILFSDQPLELKT